MAKLNRSFVRSLTFITLVIAACSFIIGVNWSFNESNQGMRQVTAPWLQTSPLALTRHEVVLNSAGKQTAKSRIISLPESKSVSVNPKPNSQAQSRTLNSDSLPDSPISPVPTVKESSVEEASSDMATQVKQFAETFPVPTEFQAKIVKKVKPSGLEKVVALTFDDGPWPRTTSQVLEILRKEDIRATFFWVGQYLQAHPEIAVQVVADGHALGNHTWHHWYRSLNQPTAAHEIDDTTELIYKITGIKTLVFRPPGGLLNNGVADYAKEQKYVTVMWSVDSMDYRPFTAQQLVKNVTRKIEPGSIVLMHDGGGNRSTTVEALPKIIAQLKELGYSFVTIPQLLEMNEKERSY